MSAAAPNGKAQQRFAFPGPRPSRVFGRYGNIFSFYRDMIGYTRDLFRNYGNPVALVAGGGTRIYSPLPECPGTIFGYGPALVKELTTKADAYHKFPLTLRILPARGADSPRAAPLKTFGSGLAAANGDVHIQRRKTLAPAFHPRQIANYAEEMTKITREFVGGLKAGEDYDIGQLMHDLTMRNASKLLLGDAENRSSGAGHLMQSALAMLSPATVFFRYDIPGLPYKRFLDEFGKFDTEMRQIIARKRSQPPGEQQDILDVLMKMTDESGTGFSEEDLIGHAGIFFVAGHETSAKTLTWTFFLLSQHPQVASDLLDEIEGVLRGGDPTPDNIKQLTLMGRVINESMRLLPPAPWNGRVAVKPTEIGGYEVPVGTEVMVSVYETHRMPELYPEPLKFRPERWENSERTAFEFSPFSAGPRRCLGEQFALMQMKIALAMLLPRFRPQLLPTVPIDRSIRNVMGPKHGVPVRLYPQDRQFASGVGGVRGNVREMVDLPS